MTGGLIHSPDAIIKVNTRMGCLAAALLSVAVAGAQERTRDEIPEQYKWDLTDLYPSDDAWRAEKERLQSSLHAAAAFRGTLGQSAVRLAEALELQTSQEKTLARLYVYAGLKADEDTRQSGPQGMADEMTRLASAFSAQWAWLEPELLTLDAA